MSSVAPDSDRRSADHTLGTTAVKSIPLLVFFSFFFGEGEKKRPRDGGEAAACSPPLVSRLIAATAPDGRRSEAGQRDAHRRRDSPREDVPRREIISVCDARTPQTPPDDTAGTHAHHGRLCPDRRRAVLPVPPQPHLGELLRAGKNPERTQPAPLCVFHERFL